MRILYVNHYAGGPSLGMEFRPYYLAREWVKAGHDVTVVAASHAHTRQTDPATNGAVTIEMREGIRFVWLKTPPYKGNGLARVRNMGTFVLRLFRHLPALTRENPPDAVIASSTYPLDFYPARWIARRHGARLAFELHDLWPLTPMELGGMSPNHPFIRVLQAAENAWCRDCDVAVSILPHADRHLRAHGLDPAKFVHVPNGIDLEEWNRADPAPLPEAHRNWLESPARNGRFRLGYAGALGVSNAMDVLLDAAARIQDLPLDVAIVGNGPERERLEARAKSIGLTNLAFLGPLPKAAIPGWLERMDALFLSFAPSPLYAFGVSPNKVFDYMMSARPVVYAVDAANDTVQDAACGLSVPPQDPEALAGALATLLRTSQEERDAMGQRGRAFILAHHTYPQLAARFLDALRPSIPPQAHT
jgi:glycosyltransferase involved in cell wall biosynthesis